MSRGVPGRRRRPATAGAALAGMVLALTGAGCGNLGATAAASGAGSPGGARADAAAARAVPDGDWRTFDYTASRTGVGPARDGIGVRELGRLRVRVVAIDGTADSSAIQLHRVRVRGRIRDAVILTTSYGRTIALDPGTGTKLWEFVPASAAALAGSGQFTTATPVADPDRRYVYSASPDGRIHKLLVASGREVRSRHWPVKVTFDPTREKIASALNLSGRVVIVTTDGYIGDAPTYQGHVVEIDRASGRITHVWNSLCSNRHHLIDPPSSCPHSDSAIWGRAGAVVEPGSGRLLVATGNGDFDGHTDWGDSTLELSPSLALLHNWTPVDQQQLNDSDTDLGSTSPAILPAFGAFRLAVQGGKAGRIALLDLRRLNGTRGGAGPRAGGELQDISTPGGGQMLTAPAIWSHRGRIYALVADGSGTAAYVLGDPRRPRLSVAWQNGTAGTSPVVAGGLLFVFDPGGTLNVYNPASGTRLAALPAAGGHWNSPIVVGGRIILPTGNANDHSTSGSVLIYHLPGR